MTKLRDICTINPKAPALADDLPVSFVPMPKVGENGEFDPSDTRPYHEVKKGFTSFRDGDVLFAKITPCMENGKGAVAWSLQNGYGFGSTEFHVLRPNPNLVTSEWLYYLTSWGEFRKDAESNMTGSAGQKRVPKSFLENYEVNLPDIQAQYEMTQALDKIRHLITLRKEQLTKLDQLVKSRFVEMFGAIDVNHSSMHLIDYADVLGGYAFKSEHFCENEIPVVRISNIANGKVHLDEQVCYSEKFWLENSKYRVQYGDVLMAMSGATTGKAGIYIENSRALVNQRVACIRAKKNISCPEFLYAATQMEWMYDLIQESSAGCAQPNISGKQIEHIPVPYAPYDKQLEFASFIEQTNKTKLTIQSSLDKLELMKKALMQEYFG